MSNQAGSSGPTAWFPKPFSSPTFKQHATVSAFALSLAWLLPVLTWETPAHGQLPPPSTPVALKSGDIIYADSGDAIAGGFVIKVDGKTGAQTVVSSGRLLRQPFGVVIDSENQIVVTDSARLIRIDPLTGTQKVIADDSSGLLGSPYGIALNHHGAVLAANLQAILAIDPVAGHTEIVASGGHLRSPVAIALAEGGEDLFILDLGSPPEIIRLNLKSHAQTIISKGGYLKSPQSIVVKGSALYVTDVATPDGNFGTGRIIQIDARTGVQKIVSEGGRLVGPVGIAVNEEGSLIVGDPYVIRSTSPDLYDGGIIAIDPASGAQRLLAQGRGSFVNPRGVAIVRSSRLTRELETTKRVGD